MKVTTLAQCLAQEDIDEQAFGKSVKTIIQLELETIDAMQKMPPEWRSGLYLGHSGGKDSVVIHDLARRAFDFNVPVVHTPKPRDTHPETVKFLYRLPFPVQYVPKEFHKDLGYKVQIDGSRRGEYNRTNGRSTHIVVQGKEVSREYMAMFVENGLFGLNFVYPICFWSNEDVWAYIYMHELEISDEYFED